MRKTVTTAAVLHRAGGKVRLAPTLNPAGRRRIAADLLERVSSALVGAGLEIRVVGGDIPDPGRGLDAAFRLAVSELGVPLLVTMSDLPRLTSTDVEAVIAEPGDVVIARCEDGGTGAVLLRRRGFPAIFGGASALRNAAIARSEGLWTRVVDHRGFALDIDTSDQLGLIGPRHAEALGK